MTCIYEKDDSIWVPYGDTYIKKRQIECEYDGEDDVWEYGCCDDGCPGYVEAPERDYEED